MPVVGKNRPLLHHLATVQKKMKEQRQLVTRLEKEERVIRGDPELTPEQKRHRVQQARLAGQAKWRALQAEIEAARDASTTAAGVERSNRPLDSVAHNRVRDLLARKVPPIEIAKRALAQKNDEMLAAVRAELLWFGPGRDIEDAGDAIAFCDRGLAEIGMGEEADNNRALIALDETLPQLDAVAQFSGKSVLGEATPKDRLRMAFATGQTGRERSDDA